MSTAVCTSPAIPITSNALQSQQTSSFCGRLLSTISRNSNYVAKSVNHIAQSILSKCIYLGSLGRYTLDDLKNYFFAQRVPLENKSSSDQPNSAKAIVPPPPPPPPPMQEQLNNPSRLSGIMPVVSSVVSPLKLQEQRNSLSQASSSGAPSAHKLSLLEEPNKVNAVSQPNSAHVDLPTLSPTVSRNENRASVFSLDEVKKGRASLKKTKEKASSPTEKQQKPLFTFPKLRSSKEKNSE